MSDVSSIDQANLSLGSDSVPGSLYLQPNMVSLSIAARFIATFVICAGTVLLTLPSSAAEFPTTLRVPEVFGVNIHFTDAQPGEMEMLSDAGFNWVRMDFTWSQIEKKKGEYDFTQYDRLVRLCEKHHVRLMAIFDYSSPFYDENLSPHSDEGIAAFTKWALATVKHFQGKQILWEMYNEPNGFWRPKPDVNAYIKLALSVGKALKAEFPNELHCGPGLSGTDAAWLEPCYNAGLLQYWDAVTVHPYGDQPPEAREPHYQGVRALLEKYRPAGKSIPLLSGEWGFTVSRVGRETQGKYLARQFLFNISSGIPLSIWYDWRDDGPDPKEGEHNFGTVANGYRKDQNPVLEPKPAYLAAKTLTTELTGCTFDKRLSLSNATDFALALTNAAETRVACWTTATNSHPAKLQLPSASYSVVGWRGETLPPVAGTNGSVTLELVDAPKYLRPIKQ